MAITINERDLQRVAGLPSRTDRKKQPPKQRIAQLEESYALLLADHLQLLRALRDVTKAKLPSYYDQALAKAQEKVTDALHRP